MGAPRLRGDEPREPFRNEDAITVLPAYAGMSLLSARWASC